MEFVLQHGLTDNPKGWRQERSFLDERCHDGAEFTERIEADTWLEAREKVDA
jgi:hypothetical protein